jgi:hypothetical protein
MTMQAGRIRPWGQGSHSCPRICPFRCKRTATDYRSTCAWWPIQSLVAYIMTIALRKRQRDHVDTMFTDHRSINRNTKV